LDFEDEEDPRQSKKFEDKNFWKKTLVARS